MLTRYIFTYFSKLVHNFVYSYFPLLLVYRDYSSFMENEGDSENCSLKSTRTGGETGQI